jgi:hypothetical protein
MRKFLTAALMLFTGWCFGQLPLPENGVKTSTPELIVLKNARIIQNSTKTIENAAIIIEKGACERSWTDSQHS